MEHALELGRSLEPDTPSGEPNKWSILEEYARDERRRVEQLKADLVSGATPDGSAYAENPEDTHARYEREKIIDRPKTIKKIGRAALDSLGIHFKFSETQRNREAMSIALDEYNAEKVEGILNTTERAIAQNVQNIMERDAYEEREAEKERDALAYSIGTYHEVADSNRHKFFGNMARQEQLEREFNENLTPIDEIELYAEAGDPRVTKESIQFKGEDIPVYHLKGFPMKFLGHVVNYREGDRINTGGQAMSDSLIENPDLWNDTPENYQKGGAWNLSEATKANTLSTSYVDLTTGIDSYDHLAGNRTKGRVVYGFDHVRPTSLLYAKHRDGQTPPRINQSNTYRDDAIDKLSESAGSISELNDDNATNWVYNEVAMFRYDDNGKPLEPKFMVTDLTDLSKDTNAYHINDIKHHAAAHGIPIIQIDRESYPNPY